MVLIWEYSARAIQWIPTWQGLDGFHFSAFCHLVMLTKLTTSSVRVKRVSNTRTEEINGMTLSDLRCTSRKETTEVPVFSASLFLTRHAPCQWEYWLYMGRFLFNGWVRRHRRTLKSLRRARDRRQMFFSIRGRSSNQEADKRARKSSHWILSNHSAAMPISPWQCKNWSVGVALADVSGTWCGRLGRPGYTARPGRLCYLPHAGDLPAPSRDARLAAGANTNHPEEKVNRTPPYNV